MLTTLKKRILAVMMSVTFTVGTMPSAGVALADSSCGTGEGEVCDISTSVSCSVCDGDMLDHYNADGSLTCASCGEVMYSVVSPVGYSEVPMIEQGARLDTLSGKTIALVGGSFNASVTHTEIKKCILEEYPDVKIYLLSEIGSGGAYSVVKQSEKSKEFQKKLKELKVDAVITGNCGCGVCTVKEAGSSIAAEYLGIPTVTVGAPTFIATIHSTGVNRGVPVLRTAEYPGAFSADSKDTLKKNAREILWPQIKELLTTAITEDEIAMYANTKGENYDAIVSTGTYEEIQDLYEGNCWSDGLPIVPPTQKRVEEYLKYTPYEAGESLGAIAPAYRECKAYTVAVNAVISGVPKEYMPLCIAFVNCMNEGEWRKPLSSTHGWSPYAWINGPIARQLGIDFGQGMISEENNKALGRFIDLAIKNIGGYYVKENSMTTFGNLTPFVLAEDEQACVDIGWKPYHMTQGYDLNSNTITAASALEWGNSVTPATTDAEQIMKVIAWDITEKQQNGLGTTNPQVYRTLMMTPVIAKNLAQQYKSKDVFEDALIDTARRPLWLRTYAHYWANTGSQLSTKKTIEKHYEDLKADPAEKVEETEVPDWFAPMFEEGAKIDTIQTMLKGDTPILITGDASRNKTEVLPGGGYATTEIELPANWDELMAELGYEPLSSFYLDSSQMKATTEVPGMVQVPDVLPDGDYIIAGSQNGNALTNAKMQGKVAYTQGTGVLRYLAKGETQEQTVTLDKENKDAAFSKLLVALGVASSFTISGGKVTNVILRPSVVSGYPNKDASILTDASFEGTGLTIAANPVQSANGGAVTVNGATIVMSATVTEFSVDLTNDKNSSETIQSDTSNTPDFLTLNGNKVTLSKSAKVGSEAKIGVKVSDGVYRTFTFKKAGNNKITISYCTEDTLCEIISSLKVDNGTVGVTKTVGEEMALDASAEGMDQDVSYQFIAYDESSKKKITISSESNSNTYTWKSTTAGTYVVYAEVIINTKDAQGETKKTVIRSNGIKVVWKPSENVTVQTPVPTSQVSVTEEPKTTDEPKITEEPKTTEEPKVTEGPKVTETPKKTEEPKTTPAVSNTKEPIPTTAAPTQCPTASPVVGPVNGNNLTVYANGGNIAGMDKIILEWNETKKYGELPNATRKGYSFEGWYTESVAGDKITESNISSLKKNSSLYAHWKKISLSKVKISSAKRSGKKVTLKWKKVGSASGYQICYSLKKDFKKNTKKTVKVTQKKITGLKSGKTYYFKVRAYKTDSAGQKVYGSWSKVKKVKGK